jgi:uncharacterized protein YkwD
MEAVMNSTLKLSLVFMTCAVVLAVWAVPAVLAAPPSVGAGGAPLPIQVAQTFTSTLYLPILFGSGAPSGDDWLAYVNYYRALAGVPPVNDDAVLNDHCYQHARYMAENNHLTHYQDEGLPYASPAGQACAENANVWLGGATGTPFWEPRDSIDAWMGSSDHRLWLLYPTTPTFGYGFYTAANNRAGAALDVLTGADFLADYSYTGWPVRYPAPGQISIPATRFPITLAWRYFGPRPVLTSTSLTTAGGTSIPRSANNSSSANHKRIEIVPFDDLPDNTVFEVSVTGSYDGVPFSYTWKFSTGDTPIP